MFIAKLEKGLQSFNLVTAMISGGIIMVMMFLTVVDVTLRYLFRKPIIWNFDLQTLLIVVVVFLGIAYVQNQRRHVMVDILITHLSSINQLWFRLFNNILFLCFSALVSWQTSLQTYDAFILSDYLDGIVRIPIWPAKAAITLGAGVLSLTLILHILEDIRCLLQARKTNGSVAGWYVKLAIMMVIWILIIAGTYYAKGIEIEPVTVGIISIILMLLLLFVGTPIAPATGIVTLWGIFILSGASAALGTAGSKPFQFVLSYIMSVIPLFLIMGIFAGIAGFATEAYEAARRWLQGIPGGLVHATIAGMALFSAASGTSTAACATFTKLVLPELFRLGVQRSLALGSIACAATLDIMIPPSITLVTYALLTQQSVGKVIIASIIPGIIQAIMYMALVFIRCKINPSLIPKSSSFSWKEKFAALSRAWGLLFIIFVVMGGIYTGIFTPIEAAAIATFVAFIAVIILKKDTFTEIKNALIDTVTMTSSIVLIIIGGMMFGSLLAQSRLPVMMSEFIAGLDVPPLVIMIAIMAFYLILGAFIDALSTLIITLPITFPAIIALGYDPIWYGIMITITIEVALVSPPYGLNLFMMQATVPGLKMTELYRGVIWYIVIDVISLALFIAVPELALWLPGKMLGGK